MCDTARMISIVVAADKNGAIGIENKIPWHIKSDLVRLAQLTRGHTVILGRKSYDSMVWYYDRSGRQMPGDTYIVVTRNQQYKPARENAVVAHSMQNAIETAKKLGDEDIFVIGGGSMFAAALPITDRIYLTEVQTTLAGDIDAYFKITDPAAWHEVSREHFSKNEKDDHDTELIILERR